MTVHSTYRAISLTLIIIGMMISPFSHSDTTQLCADVCESQELRCIEDVSMTDPEWARSLVAEGEMVAGEGSAPRAAEWVVQRCPSLGLVLGGVG